MSRTKDFADIIRQELASDPDLAAAVEAESLDTDVAMKVYELRTAAGLTQQQLADRIGSRQSVISRIENANRSSRPGRCSSPCDTDDPPGD